MSVDLSPARKPRHHRFWTGPTTLAGRRAAWLSLAPVALTMITGPLAAVGAYEWSRGVRIAVLGIPTFAMLLCSLAAGVLAVRALRQGDRSAVLLWPLLVGASVVLFVVGEFAFPH